MTWLSKLVFLVLATLVVDPCAKALVLLALRGDYRMPMQLFVFIEFMKAFQPKSLMCVPAKANIIELGGSFSRHVGGLSLLHQNMVAALFLDP